MGHCLTLLSCIWCVYLSKSHLGNVYSGQHLIFHMQEYEVGPCLQELRHDWFQCPGYHAKGSDKRRNPYIVAYLPDYPGLTGTEKAYHPLNFCRKFCGSFLGGGKCKYGEFCAFAHEEIELQTSTPTYEEEMKDLLYPTQPRPQISEYVPHLRDPEPVCPPEIHSLRQIAPQPRSRSFDIRLTSWEVVVLRHSKMKLWQVLKDTALQDLCNLQLAEVQQHSIFLQIQGPNAEEASQKLLACFRPMPSTYVLQKMKQYSGRIIKLLSERLETRGTEYFTRQNSKDRVWRSVTLFDVDLVFFCFKSVL